MTEAEELELLELEEQEYQFQKSRASKRVQTPPPKEKKGLLGRALDKVESYTSAPARAAVSAIQNDESALDAFGRQFGEDPALAPTGKKIAADAGVPDEKIIIRTADEQSKFDKMFNPGWAASMKQAGVEQKDVTENPAELAGVVVEGVVDPTNLLPLVGPAAKGVSKGARATGGLLKELAEKSAVRATGATGKQAAKFADDAGRELLDRGIVRFGESQAKTASRAEDAVEAANKQIDSALTKLDSDGVKVDVNEVYNTLRKKIDKMRSDPSQADVADKLEKELDNILAASDVKGSSQFGILEAEKIKRGFNRKAGNWMDPEKSQAGKEAYQAFRDAVEKSGRTADPKTTALFEEGKKTYGLMEPIREAAEARALTTSQSPLGGLLDLSSAGGGAVVGGPAGAIMTPVARRVLAPRMSSSLAVASDKISKSLLSVPEFKQLAEQNPKVFKAVVLQMAAKQVDSAGMLAAENESESDTDNIAQNRVDTGLLKKKAN